MRRGITLSGLLHGSVIALLVLGLPSLWLFWPDFFKEDSEEPESVNWATLLPESDPEPDPDEEEDETQSPPAGGRPQIAGKPGDPEDGADNRRQEGRTASRPASGAETSSADPAAATRAPSAQDRTKSGKPSPQISDADKLAVEIIDPETFRRAMAAAEAAHAGTQASGTEGAGQPAEGEMPASAGSPESDASATPAADQGAASGGRDTRIYEAPPRPARPKTRDIGEILDYVAAIDPRAGDVMRRLEDNRVAALEGARPEDAALDRIRARQQAADRKSFERIFETAEIGYAPAQYAVGVRELIGRGTEANAQEAVAWLQKAAEQNYAPAQRILGFLHGRAIGTPRDLAKAHFWWTQAAQAGDEIAREGKELLEPIMPAKDLIESRKLSAQWAQIMSEVAPPQARPEEKREMQEELRRAAETGDIARVRTLLALGVDAQATDKGGKTALINAAWRGYEKVVEVMLEFGSDPDFTDQNGLSALTWSAVNGHAKAAGKLVEAGADVNHQDRFGMTPLMRAAWNGHKDVVEKLLESGAATDFRNGDRDTALDIARREGYAEIVELIRKKG